MEEDDDAQNQANHALVREFTAKRHLYAAYTSNIVDLLANLMRIDGVHHLPIESRTKEITKFEQKLVRPDKQGKYKSYADMTDLTGARIVVFYEDDVDRVCAIIANEFAVDWSNSLRRSEIIDPDRFGYLSTHYVVSHKAERSALKENEQFADFKAEIQVRTVVQHAWATIDRNLRYNNENDIPKELKRRLFRVSALLEVADQEFTEVYKTIKRLRESYGEAIKKEDSLAEIPINKESMDALYRESKSVGKIADRAAQIGITFRENPQTDLIGSFLVKMANALACKNVAHFEYILRKTADSDINTIKKYVGKSGFKSTTKFGWVVRCVLAENGLEQAKVIIDAMGFAPRTRDLLLSGFEL